MTISTTLFETPGPHNTQRTVELALAAARELGIETIVIASTTGVVADCVLEQDLTGLHPVIVSHAYGFLEDGQNEMPQDKRRRYEQLGIPVCTAAHPLSGAERSLRAPRCASRPRPSPQMRASSCRGVRSSPSAAPETAPIRRWCCAPPTPTACLRQGSTFLSANPCVRSTNQPQRPVF